MLKPAPSPFASVRLALLDRDSFNVTMVRDIAATCGIRGILAFDEPEAAIAALKRPSRPNIMLVHHQPPDGSGLAFCRAVRDRATSPDPFLPLILITAHATRQNVFEARDAGVDEFMASPFSPKTLSTRISSVLYNRRGFVDVGGFFGPDRRRGAMAEMLGVERRSAPIELIDPNTRQTYMG